MAYSKEEKDRLFKIICNEITEKGTALRNILKRDEMPATETFYRWLRDDDKSKQYARATEFRAEKIFDEMLDIADDQQEDIIEIDGKDVVNHNVIQRSKLRIDTRKWMLSKLNPKKFSDKVQVDQNNTHTIKDFDIKKLYDKKA